MKQIVVLALLSAVLPGIQAADPLVRTDLIVRDSRGRMVRNLEPGDFTVTEDGAKSTVRNLHFEDGSKAGHPDLITLLFEDLSGEMGRFSREGALSVLSAKTANTQISVFRVGDRIEALQGFSGDPRAIRLAVEA
ncbi:MAG: hypothetical protein NTY38_04360, partial [Acidobacteria bacterium]|nr:hypothetical protein [Acidobacteriota bacterium]